MRFNTVVCLCIAGAILLNIAGSFCQSDVCGRAPLNSKNKIVGGKDTTAGSWPWQVSIHGNIDGTYLCGGTLISKRWVLSAAHCFEGFIPNFIVIYLGRQSQGGPNPNEEFRGMNQFIRHDKYNSSTKDNDIALLQLTSAVIFNNYIRPVCLAAANSTFGPGTESWVTGWGKLNAQSSQSANQLQEANIPIVNTIYCIPCFKDLNINNMICAGNRSNADACQGDSGGPLVSKTNDSQWIQTGIVSFGDEFCKSCPGIYTSVSKYEEWIKSKITDDLPGFVAFSSSRSSFNTFNCFLFSLFVIVSIIPFNSPFYSYSKIV